MVQMDSGPQQETNGYYADQGPEGGAQQTAERNEAQHQIAEHRGSILNTSSKPVADVAPVPNGTSITTGTADVSISDAAMQVGANARETTMQMLAGVDISDAQKQEIAMIAEQQAKYVAVAREGQRDVNLELNKDELKEIDQKMAEALEMLEAELEDIQEQQRLAEREGNTEITSEGIVLAERARNLDDLIKLLDADNESLQQIIADMDNNPLAQADSLNQSLLEQINSEYIGMVQTNEDMFGNSLFDDALTSAMEMTREFGEAGEEMAQEEQRRLDALKARMEAQFPELNFTEAHDTAVEIYAELADIVREQREAQLEEQGLTLAV